jgi:hypothetical protein
LNEEGVEGDEMLAEGEGVPTTFDLDLDALGFPCGDADGRPCVHVHHLSFFRLL